MEVTRKIIIKEIKYHIHIPIITSLMVYLLIFILFGIVELKRDIVLMIVERFLPLMGVILISPCFQYEMNFCIQDVIGSRPISILAIYINRVILRIFIYGILTFLFIVLIKTTGSQMEIGLYFFHSLSIGLFLGALGFLIFSISSHLIGSYLGAILFYLINWMPNWKALGDFYLFRLRYGLEPKIGLNIFITVVFIAMGLYMKKR